jgi:hypothetical protein
MKTERNGPQKAAGPRWRSRRGAGALYIGLPLILALAASCDGPTATAPVPAEPAIDAESATSQSGANISAWLDFEADGTLRSYVALADHVSAADRMLELMAAAHEGGTSGFYLREIGGAVHLAENETFAYEPASTIKALVHFHAMRQVQDATVIDGDVVTLGRQIPLEWATVGDGSCPQPAAPTTGSLETGLTAMMVPSDNPWTQALRDFFGDGAIDATRQAFGMDDSVLQHRIGCGADAVANPNRLTLVDGGKMYEAVSAGYLTGAARDAAYFIMLDDAALFNTMIDEEAAGLGLSAGGVSEFKARRRSALKAGSYGLSTGLYRSVAGWAELAYKDASCALAEREYVYGAFIHAADTLTGMGIRALGVETFREQVRGGLESWAACEADLRIVSPQVLDLPGPLHVNELVAFTVRQTFWNDGPAPSVDAILTTTMSAPDDCTVNPSQDVRLVPGVGSETVQVDIPFTLTCSDPSNHLFQLSGEIMPADPAIVDPDLDNNTNSIYVTRAFIAYADLAVTGWDFSELDGAGLGDLMVGETFTFVTGKTVRNFGDTELDLYHDPADVLVRRTMVVPDGIRGSVRVGVDEPLAQVVVQREGQADEIHDNVAPGTVVEAVGPATVMVNFRLDGLAVDEERAVAEEFGIECLAGGWHQLAFSNEVTAVDPHLLDPDPDNNLLEVERDVECVVPVQINIRPGNRHNQINPTSQQSVPVAVLTTDADEYDLPLAFDATAIQPASARFGTLGVLGLGGGSGATQSFARDSFEMDDRTRDGDTDLVLHFGIAGTGADAATDALCVVGQFLADGGALHTFLGCDMVDPRGPGGP